ncbi:MAG: NAD(P)H-hydrate dehydratase, partial [Oscillospiraceae bacterium]|nr:NAD(P)H-hydrate dehydratase [Oscillospiraceae bacterium]
MQSVLSAENMKRSDAYACAHGAGGRELMRRAGEGIFAAAQWKAPVAILCGSGNNAGDGYVLALCLKRAGIPCTLFLLRDKFSVDGGYYYAQCIQAGIPALPYTEQTDLTRFGSIADCIFGTGFRGQPHGLAAHAINAINASGAYVVSADINSGLDADSGMASLAVKSNLTVSVGGWKTGHFLGMAKDLMQEKCNIDIGIAPQQTPYGLLQDSDILPLFTPRKNRAHKGSYGYVALMGGSVRYSGAVRLAELANSCMRTGAGVTLLATPKTLATEIRPLILESTLYPLSDDGEGNFRFCEEELRQLCSRVNTASVGMGFGVSAHTEQAVAWLLQNFTGTLILDADALTCLAAIGPDMLRNRCGNTVLTPHLREFSRLCGKSVAEIEQAPIALAMEYAAQQGVVLLLKGPTTIITDGSRVLLTDSGCAGMATAGSGDVLAGVMAAVCGAHPEEPLLAAAAAAHLAGRAGVTAQKRYGAAAMLAGDTANALRDTLAALT